MTVALKAKPQLGSQVLPFILLDASVLLSPASVRIASGTETADMSFNLARTVTWTTSLPTTQRAIRIQAPTYACSSSSTITTASTLAISGAPTAGTNATLTNAYALNIEAGKTKVNDKIVLQNGAWIEGLTSGSNQWLNISPTSSAGSTDFFIRFARTATFNFGVDVFIVKQDDLTTNTGNLRFKCAAGVGNDSNFFVGDSSAYIMRMTTTGNDTLHISCTVNNATYSGAVAIVSNGTSGQANRSPTTNHVDPHLYVYSADSTQANDFIRMSHDQTDGNIATGNGNINLAPADTVFLNGGLKVKRNATATDLTVTSTHYLIGVTSTAAARTITMPSAATVGAGKTYIIKDESGGAATNNISIASVSSQTFDGAASPLVINTNYGTKTLYSDGANWFTI